MSSNSKFSNTTSKSYALALYELSKEKSEIEKIVEDLKNLNELLNDNIDFRDMILNPTVDKEDKGKVLSEISKQYNFCETLRSFLGFVTMKNRLFFISKIIESFLHLISKNKGELNAKLISSKELSTKEQKEIEKELSENFKSKLNIQYKYDSSLIAGLIIQVGSVMVDTSIKTKLKRLEKNMVEA